MATDEAPAARDPVLPWHRVRRTIVVVDMVESVRLMDAHEAEVIDYWRHFVHAVRTDLLPGLAGRMVKSLGDGLLLAFTTARDGVRAAHALHALVRDRPLLEGAAPVQLRIGLHLANVFEDDIDVYGSGVNLAARLAASAAPGTTWASAEVCEELTDGIDADLEDLGEIYLKHLALPVRAHVCAPPGAGPRGASKARALDDLRPALAIVPFQCRDASDAHSVLGDLIVDELTAQLGRCADWRLISKLSAAACSGRPMTVEGLGAALHADYVCTGAYQIQGGHVTVQSQLVNVATGEVLRGSSQHAAVADLLVGQSALVLELGASIAEAICAHGIEAVASTPLPQLHSHELMLGAMALMHRTRRTEFGRALEIIEHLEQRHPRSAQPSAWRAKWHVLRVVQGWSDDPAQDGRLALQAGRRATAADGRSSLALAMQGLVHAYLHRDFDAAADCYDEALMHNPNEAMALLLRGTMHAFLGQGGPAYAQTQQALRLSPLDPLRYFYLSLAASAAVSDGRYREAVGLAEASLRLNRVHLSTYRALAMAQSLAGEVGDAERTVEQLLRLDPGYTTTRFRERFPGRDRAPEFTHRLADALAHAGLPP